MSATKWLSEPAVDVLVIAKIRQLRGAGLKQSAVARELGMAVSTVRKYCSVYGIRCSVEHRGGFTPERQRRAQTTRRARQLAAYWER